MTTVLRFASTKTEVRFFKKIKETVDGCWEWTGARNYKGYGQFRHEGKTLYAHRVSHSWFYGPQESVGLDVDHLCRNRACVNPEHLEAVTHAENVRRGETGKYPFGHRTHCGRGHAFDAENTRMRADGRGRVCRTCARENVRAFRLRGRSDG